MISFNKLGHFGRLANQLFQISTVISLALDNNDKYIFPEWKYEDRFNLHNCFSNDIKFKNIYKEPFFNYQKIPYQKSLDIEGYFQSYKYFENNADIILGLLTPTNLPAKKWNATAIHVRRGDYVNNPAYEQLDINYYNEAMNIIKSKKYFVFSDDISYCKKMFIGNQFEFVEGNDEVTDLSHMISCENQIMANSSFSWWGAWLNSYPGKTIIAPKKWFGPGLAQHDTKDLLWPEVIKV